jgi:hypothetical protein
VLTSAPAHEPAAVRLLLVLGAQAAFVTLTDLLTGTPPAFLAIVDMGLGLALALAWQARGAQALS